KEIGRVPAERDTNYKILKKFDKGDEVEEGLDKITDASQFGSYAELIKINKFNYKNPRRK
ncbi:MAG: 7,8-didemethyl-8-hydroxy-5-deazariboflavin synthase subunit CofH, partial [Nitrosopumilus sp.]